MKILVMSDSHGRKSKMETIISQNTDADVIVFLGDGLSDFEDVSYFFNSFAGKKTIAVRGNCDYHSDNPETVVAEFGTHRFLITHGHEYGVKNGVTTLLKDMRESGCDIGLYGHTHEPRHTERAGHHLFNPGAVENGEYGIIFVDGNFGTVSFSEEKYNK